MAAKKRAGTGTTGRAPATTRAKAPPGRATSTRRRAPLAPPAAKTATSGAPTGGMTVREAGRKGGLIGGRKGGETVKAERGIGFYREIGRMGGQKVRELIEAGRAAMAGA